jgi:AraC family transcriptional regulator, transcriptional activator of pobA
LEDRSRPSGWNIRPHAHHDLHHVLYIMTGGGDMRAEQRSDGFVAPALLLVPARAIHGFTWHPETTGRVLTLSAAYAEELFLRAPVLRGLFGAPGQIAIAEGTPQVQALDDALTRLSRELNWTAPGHAAAVEALLVAFLVEVLRLAQGAGEQEAAPGRQAELVARFRHLLEAEFRNGLKLERYAARLHVSLPQLRAACLQIAHCPPGRLLQDRLILEAKRALLYSNMSIAEVAYALGLSDPAYFSRLFLKAMGKSPRAFRRQP